MIYYILNRMYKVNISPDYMLAEKLANSGSVLPLKGYHQLFQNNEQLLITPRCKSQYENDHSIDTNIALDLTFNDKAIILLNTTVFDEYEYIELDHLLLRFVNYGFLNIFIGLKIGTQHTLDSVLTSTIRIRHSLKLIMNELLSSSEPHSLLGYLSAHSLIHASFNLGNCSANLFQSWPFNWDTCYLVDEHIFLLGETQDTCTRWKEQAEVQNPIESFRQPEVQVFFSDDSALWVADELLTITAVSQLIPQ